jgi:hypothetical protein
MGDRTKPSQPERGRKEGEGEDSSGSYTTNTRSYDLIITPKSTESRELSFNSVPYGPDRTG